MYPEELTAGNWGPLNFTVQRTFGCDAAVLFAHLSQIAKRYAAKKTDGWFYIGQPKLIEVTGMTRKPLERSIDILANAGLLMIDKRGQNNTRHYQLVQSLEQLEAICAAFASAPAQTPTATKKTAPRANKAANTAKEQSFGNPELVQEPSNHTEQPLEMVQPVGKPDQLPAEKPKKTKANTAEIEAAAVRLIEHFNAVAGTAFRTTGKANIECFGRVLKAKEGTEEEIRMVIELKTMQWANKPEMREYLKPETLCRPSHFSKYLEECYNAKAQLNNPWPAAANFSAQVNNTIFNKSDARIAAMVMGQLQEHPGMANFLDPKYTKVEYLIALSESEIRHQLREAKRKWELSKYSSSSNDNLPF